jgi:O-antigen ligase
MTVLAVSRFADHAGRLTAIAVGFTLPISAAMDNVLLAAVLLFWIVGTRYVETLKIIRTNAVCLGALILFLVLALGTLHGNQSINDARQHLSKYLDLAVIPIFAYYFRDPIARRNGLLMFASAMTIVLVLSFLVKFGILELGAIILGTTGSPVVFKYRITHNFLMAFSAFLFTWLAMSTPFKMERPLYLSLAALATFNVVLMVEGATGYVVLLTLAFLLAIDLLPKRLRAFILFSILVVASALTLIPNPFSSRISTISGEIQAWQRGSDSTPSSAGLRLEFYKNTLDIIAEHPLTGVGTGGFAKAYAEQVKGTGKTQTRNPHNEYLLVAVQTGVIGLIALLALFVIQWITAHRLPTRLETGLARGLVLTMSVGCLFNSFLLDHTEGLFYAWFTGLLYGGLVSVRAEKSPAQQP